MSISEPYRKVLLVLIAHPPSRRVLDAACALCDRLGAGLEIVGLGRRLPEDLPAATAAEVAPSGLNCSMTLKPDWDVEDLIEWANSRACVATVMVPAPEGAEAMESYRWRRLVCPLVVVGREN